MKRIVCWFRSFRMVKTVKDAKEMKLHWIRNVHGDEINAINCRSLWNDDYMNRYRCEELYNTDNK